MCFFFYKNMKKNEKYMEIDSLDCEFRAKKFHI